ncbi:hypothetical protein IJH24_01315 [Candidatus Saccharibacteria bacterium]|nr:hypothetical protein [Candidatus Saccharibacteria bacterium]
MTTGGRNLVLLGVGSILIAFIMTGVSLAVYHNSGDIYLDRSRPGFLPDEEELKEEEVKEEEYEFSKTGTLSEEVLDEYLKHLKEEIEIIDSYEEPFNTGLLSDESLGIPAEDKE